MIIKNNVDFSSIRRNIEYPDFLDIQIKSFKDFIQLETKQKDKNKEGLFKVFLENFPIYDSKNQFILEFLDYFIDYPKYSTKECLERGLTYNVSLKAKMRLSCTDVENEDFKTITQDVYLGCIPYMTNYGTFIINGSERVIVSQLHRSPGVFFSQSNHSNKTRLYSVRIIPSKGSWIEFSTDINNVMYAYIDRKKKFPVTMLFRAIGYEKNKDILKLFNDNKNINLKKIKKEELIGLELSDDLIKEYEEDFLDKKTGEIISIKKTKKIFSKNHIIKRNDIYKIFDLKFNNINVYCVNKKINCSIIENTFKKDFTKSSKEALWQIYKQLRNSDPPDEETAKNVIEKLFFSESRYSLGLVGRYRINKKLNSNIDNKKLILTKYDIISIVKYLIKISNSKTEIDDIDNLSNRRVKTVGEQLYSQFSIGLSRLSRTIKEKMNIRDNELFKPTDLINSKIISSVINSFFATNQLSQFMDQTNPLSEITHKRRLSSLGPGGLSRERAGFEVRDVHYTHYGRLCPIETPEGPNIGLISSLCIFAKINNMGFIETPYRKVNKGIIDFSSFVYLTSEDEEGKIIAQCNADIDYKKNKIINRVISRKDSDFPISEPDKINYIDISSNQTVSISASLIPFLEHDDANRALMGSNMMRQAVPLLSPEIPIVCTGIENKIAFDSRSLVIAEYDGVVESVQSDKIYIKYNKNKRNNLIEFDDSIKKYNLIKFKKTNQNTIINLKPIVKKGDKVKKNQILCEGFATKDGYLSLGRNLIVSFMPWKGYNFEDAFIISEKVIREGYFTSIHIDEYSLEVRDTKIGMEEFTNDIPNLSEELTKNLDEDGIIRIGAEVKPGDILIGKISPKGESDPTPEEKLLKAIFGEKAGNVKDSSLRAGPTLYGTVIDKKIFIKSIKDKNKRIQDKIDIKKYEIKYKKKVDNINKIMLKKLTNILNGKISNGVKDEFNNYIIKKGIYFSEEIINKIPDYNKIYNENWTNCYKTNILISDILNNYKLKIKNIISKLKRKKINVLVGDELPIGVMKLAKVYIAKKRKLKVGDKMAGRHGNKGIVSKIVPDEDMPFLEDGTPVDIILNPLGVPSRMNLGQIYETVLGFAGKSLGIRFFTPIFDGAKINDINKYTDIAKIPRFGKTYLYDGFTGERFDQPSTVGVIYILKLGHMVDDKMHSRSIGPYSLITQQPLGGKSQFGGQRFGEMEVWALESFGASNILREMITIKSDDVIGRSKTYEAIVKGNKIPEPGIPESFNVLLHELKGLCLDIELEE